jgi:general secretion pathway protein I
LKRRRQSGFSVLEALAALAIVAVAMIPLLSLQTQVSRDFIHQRALREQISAQRNSLAILRDLNVMATPSGQRQLGPDISMRWTASPLSALTRSTRQGSGEGEFEVRLYRVDIVITHGGAAPFAFSVDQIGWRALRT